ncbi:MAG: hypothetical protein WC044_03315 [Crocinitomicaceae bacterium]
MKIICSVLFLGILTQINAQEIQKGRNSIDFYWQLNALNVGFAGNVFNAMAVQFPTSSILQNHGPEAVEGRRYQSNGGSTPVSFGIGIPVKLFQSQKVKTSWRFGGDYLGNISIGDYAQDISSKRLDSTFYPQYNTSLMKDSVYSKTTSGHANGKFVQFKSDLIFRFRPDKRFTYFTGVGFGLGITSKRTSVFTYKEEETEVVSSSANPISFDAPAYNNNSHEGYLITSFTEEKLNLKPIFSPFAYIPYGIDWQLGKNRDFLKRLHVYYEGQIGARFTDAFLGTRQTNLYLSNALGLRITI